MSGKRSNKSLLFFIMHNVQVEFYFMKYTCMSAYSLNKDFLTTQWTISDLDFAFTPMNSNHRKVRLRRSNRINRRAMF
jgi:hypothetical protein